MTVTVTVTESVAATEAVAETVAATEAVAVTETQPTTNTKRIKSPPSINPRSEAAEPEPQSYAPPNRHRGARRTPPSTSRSEIV